MDRSLRYGARVRSRGYVALTIIGVVVAALLVAVGSLASGPPASADTAPPSGSNLPATVSADALPTVQENGVVWAQVLVGDTVYATGKFTETYPAGQSDTTDDETARTNLLAYNITTGALTSFNHTLNAQGLGIAASPDGSTLYVVGDFTQVDAGTSDATTANHIVAFNLSTNAVDTSFPASLSGTGNAVTATSSTVFVGGSFTQADGVAHSRLAAFVAGTGALAKWAPSADNQVDALALTSDGKRLLVGGRFVQLNSSAAYGLGALDPSTGKTLPFALNSTIHAASNDPKTAGQCGITSLTVAGDAVYGTAFSYGCGDFEGRFAATASTGAPIWIDDCHGDSYGSVPIGQVLYSVSHAHDCSAIGSFPDMSAPGGNQRALAETTYATGKDTGPDAYGWNYSGQPDATILHWFPKLARGSVTGQNQAAWSIVGNSDYIALGGEFPSVNGVAQAGLVRFAVSSDAPNTVGPIPSSALTPTVSSTSAGTVNLSWTATWDEDNENLTYQVVRDPGPDETTVATLHEPSTFWQLPTLTYTDTGLTVGSTHTYRLRILDPSNNGIGSSPSASVTVSDSGTAPPSDGPMASFTTSCSEETCSVDASNSTDTDSAITSYAWDFGDGSKQASGETVTHKYATSGQHVITLTVKDANTQNSVSQTVTTTPPPPVLVALDTFNRSSSSGWGEADAGGLWQSSGCGKLSIANKTGYVVADRHKHCSVSLSAVKRENTDSTTGLTTTKRPSNGIYLDFVGRRLSATKNIRLQLHILSSGHVKAELIAQVGTTTRRLGKSITLAKKYVAGTHLKIRLQVTGTDPTLVRGKVWTKGSQPSAWMMSGTTRLSALQHKGTVGYLAYLPKGGPSSSTVRATKLRTTLVSS